MGAHELARSHVVLFNVSHRGAAFRKLLDYLRNSEW